MLLFPENRLAYASVGCLYVNQGCYGGCYVGHESLLCGCSVPDAPTHEHKWDVGVIGGPHPWSVPMHVWPMEVTEGT